MIKAKATGRDGAPIIVIGLSRHNTELLLAGQPIAFDLSDLGLTGQIYICAGETEDEIHSGLSEFITPDTVITGRPEVH